jgi:hypothetical protein
MKAPAEDSDQRPKVGSGAGRVNRKSVFESTLTLSSWSEIRDFNA